MLGLTDKVLLKFDFTGRYIKKQWRIFLLQGIDCFYSKEWVHTLGQGKCHLKQ